MGQQPRSHLARTLRAWRISPDPTESFLDYQTCSFEIPTSVPKLTQDRTDITIQQMPGRCLKGINHNDLA